MESDFTHPTSWELYTSFTHFCIITWHVKTWWGKWGKEHVDGLVGLIHKGYIMDLYTWRNANHHAFKRNMVGSTTNLLSLDIEKRLGSSEWWSHLRWLFWQSPWCPCRWSLVHLRFQEIVDKIHLTTWDRQNMENNWNVYGMFTSIIVRLGQMKPNGMSSWKSRWTKNRDVVELFLLDNVCLRFFFGVQFNSSIMNIIHVKSCYGILDVKRTCHPSSMIFIDYGWISGWLPAGSDVVE